MGLFSGGSAAVYKDRLAGPPYVRISQAGSHGPIPRYNRGARRRYQQKEKRESDGQSAGAVRFRQRQHGEDGRTGRRRGRRHLRASRCGSATWSQRRPRTCYWCDGLAVGSPTNMGILSWKMKRFWDEAMGPHWMKVDGKIACAFSSSGGWGGGTELACQSILTVLMNFGFLVFGVTDYAGKLTTLHYGAVAAREPRRRRTGRLPDTGPAAWGVGGFLRGSPVRRASASQTRGKDGCRLTTHRTAQGVRSGIGHESSHLLLAPGPPYAPVRLAVSRMSRM